MKIFLPLPAGVNFWTTVYSHGWSALPPFRVDKERKLLQAVVDDGKGPTLLAIGQEKKKLAVMVENRSTLTEKEKAAISKSVVTMLRMDEHFDEFYKEAKRYPHFRWVAKLRAGRLLRSHTAFEDIVKMICTTNCSWALTEIIVGALVSKLGTRVSHGVYSFPTPEVIAKQSERYLRKEMRCGYRAPYLLELSRRIASGTLEVESWRTSNASTEDLFEQVQQVKGVGKYAAGNILKLLGRYDYLGIDSWCRSKFFEIYKNGRKVKDSTIEKHYSRFGKWQGLFMWMDVTKDWYKEQFPF